MPNKLKKEPMDKMKLNERKKKPLIIKKKEPHRPSIVSNYSVVSLSDVTEESLEIWRALPETIRQDPSLEKFRKKHERLYGPEQEPLTKCENIKENFTEEKSLSDEDEDQNEMVNEVVVVHVTEAEGNSQEKKHDDTEMQQLTGRHKKNKYVSGIKMIVLLIVWLMFTWFLMSKNEKILNFKQIAIPEESVKSISLNELPINPRLKLKFKGSFLTEHYDLTAPYFMYYFLSVEYRNGSSKNIANLHFPIVNASEIDTSKELKRSKIINLSNDEYESLHQNDSSLKLNLYTNLESNFPVSFIFDPSPLDKSLGIIFAAIVLMGLYIMIIWELVHRTFAAIIASTLAIGILAAMNERPPMTVIMSWIDVETLLLLFGMMILVAILSETGVFDYMAVYAFKITNGQVWPLIICLCLFTAIISSVLDNVTTILLMTPVIIRLCEVMELNPVPVLMFAIIYSNIGGALTPVGDPPNVIIASNSYISKSGINFTNFTYHMAICIILVTLQTYFQLRLKFRRVNDLRFTEPKDVQELRHEISIWQRAVGTLSSYSKDEELVRQSLLKKINRLSQQLNKKLVSGAVPTESYKTTLEDLQAKYPIKNKILLGKSAITLVFVVSFFFLHSVPNLQRLSLGWTALIGAVLLLILYDREDMEAILHHVEWSTLLFFAALFVLMEALAELGLIEWIGDQTESVILSVGEGSRLAVAILIILWVSALASAFVDNIPLTTMMVKIVISLAENEALGLPLQPLVWALALGACLGGNGTLIGASANVVCAGVAEQHGYRFTFVEFFKIGFPVMIGSIVVSTVYLMVAHVLFTWH